MSMYEYLWVCMYEYVCMSMYEWMNDVKLLQSGPLREDEPHGGSNDGTLEALLM